MLTTGKRLDGRYVVREQIGGGGFGAVFLAEDTRFGGKNLVAIKRISQNSPHFTKSFRREADLLYNLSHPNLPKVTNCFQEDGANFIVMDYISGEDLGQSFAKGKRFSVQQVLNVADKVLDALEYLHSETIFHRDIKPQNIKIDATGKTYLLDFGTAKGTFDETTLTQNVGQSISGFTPFYAPLEQVLRVDPNSYLLLQSAESPLLADFVEKRTDERSDIYSLGATVYYLLSGISPETATSTFRAFSLWTGKPDPLHRLRESNAEVPPALDDAIAKSLEIDPENRFRNATEFRAALKQIQVLEPTYVVGDSSAETVPITPPEPPTKTQPAVIPVKPIPVDPVPTSFESFSAAKTPRRSKPKALIGAALAILIFALAGVGAWFALREPVVTPTPPASENGAAKRTLNYSLLVQKMRDGKEYQAPFESSGQEIFETGYQFRLRFTPPENGFLYVFAEGLNAKNEKTIYLIFPFDAGQNGGRAEVSASRQYETGRNEFSGARGTENFWIVWSKELPAIPEKARANAFDGKTGEVADKNIASDLRSFLEKPADSKTTASKDTEKKQTKIEFTGDFLVYVMRLEHR